MKILQNNSEKMIILDKSDLSGRQQAAANILIARSYIARKSPVTFSMLMIGVLCCGLIFALKAETAFSFLDYTGMSSGQSFRIQVRPDNETRLTSVGSGTVKAANNGLLHLEFRVDYNRQRVQGDLKMEFVRSEGSYHILDIEYSYLEDGERRHGNERVQADRYLASNGLLAFSFSDDRFIQLSREAEGDRLITEGGAITLKPE